MNVLMGCLWEKCGAGRVRPSEGKHRRKVAQARGKETVPTSQVPVWIPATEGSITSAPQQT